ncbi:MAG TPA: SirB2 family protein [Verrucomicrobiota bacterium]|nr:SirB2 family protein [Verrucomicrobiota bacterium]HNT14836.1 SirB2 family protein [Verrucomicrobiota bacterium]
MTYPILKVLHLLGLALTFMGLAGVLALKLCGGESPKRRWLFFAAHGVGLLLLLGSGLALVFHLQLLQTAHALPGWVQGKFVIWLLAGGAVSLAARFSRQAELVFLLFIALVALAAWLSLFKPF